jgi:hypothetical protein
MRSTSFDGTSIFSSDEVFVSGVVNYLYRPTRLNPNRSGPFFVGYNSNNGQLVIQFDGSEWEIWADGNPDYVDVIFDSINKSFGFVLRKSLAMSASPRMSLIRGSALQIP